MVGYSRERVGYRLLDIERKVVIEERNVIFDERQKGSYYLREHNGNIKYEDWCIEDILNVSNVKYQDSNIDTDNDIESLGELDDQYENNEVESNEENECIYDRPDNTNNGNESENTIQNTEISFVKGRDRRVLH